MYLLNFFIKYSTRLKAIRNGFSHQIRQTLGGFKIQTTIDYIRKGFSLQNITIIWDFVTNVQRQWNIIDYIGSYDKCLESLK